MDQRVEQSELDTSTDVDPERSIMLLLSDAARLMRVDFERRARAIGVTTRAQYAALLRLSINEGVKQNALAELLDIEPITLGRQIDRLEADGLVERRPDPKDRRARNLYLTPKAWPRLDEFRALAMETREQVMAGLSTQEQEDLIDLLTRVRNNLSEKGSAGRRNG